MTEQMRMVDGPELTELVTMADSLQAAREAAVAAADGAVVTGRLQIDWDGGSSGTRILAAAIPSLDVFGYKQFHWIGSGVRYACHLFRASDGSPLGIVDAAALTTLRTAATAAVGVERLYGAGRRAVIAVIGSGAEARAGLRALAAVTDVVEVRVTSRSAANREAFATGMSAELGLPVVASASIREAVDSADIVYSATASGGVVYRMDDLRGVGVLATIGSTAPDQHEACGDVFAGAGTVLIDTPDALHESGDLLEAVDQFSFDPQTARLLGSVLGDDEPVTEAASLAVFKSIGSPEQDLVLAHHVLRRAEAAGLGRLVKPAMTLKQNL